MPLTGAQLQQVRDALADAFTSQGVEQLLTMRLREQMDNLVRRGNSKYRLFQPVQDFERRGTTQNLMEAAYRERPQSPNPRAAYQQLGLASAAEVNRQANQPLERVFNEANW